jgi:hypothetical protein
MPNDWLTDWLRWLGGVPSFQIYGKSRREQSWRIIDVYATPRRNVEAPLPLWAGTCVTWTNELISIGWDFARHVLVEQAEAPATRERPVVVAGGRIRDLARRQNAGATSFATASEIMAHECGHTWQAARIGPVYLALVGAVTLFGEGPHSWNRFENDASEQGQFGGLLKGSVSNELAALLKSR